MTEEQNIKAQLVMLAEYLQTSITDAQVALYARELEDLGEGGLLRAIVALKGDETLWPGRFPLPAKIRSYVVGDVNNTVTVGVAAIMKAESQAELLKLGRFEWEVAQSYGIKSILERDAAHSPTIYAQLRDALRAKYLHKATTKRIELIDPSKTPPLLE